MASPSDQMQCKPHANTDGQKGHFTLFKYLKRKKKRGKIPPMQYNQVLNVWSPVLRRRCLEWQICEAHYFESHFCNFLTRLPCGENVCLRVTSRVGRFLSFQRSLLCFQISKSKFQRPMHLDDGSDERNKERKQNE